MRLKKIIASCKLRRVAKECKRIVVAPQGFKGTFTPVEAALAMQEGIRSCLPGAEVVLAPVADGGDGTLEVLMHAYEEELQETKVTGPFVEEGQITALWGLINDVVVIETARIFGMSVTLTRNPMLSTTYGLGELLRQTLDAGYRNYWIGLGGSCTNDGGAGFAQALGAHLLDREGRELPQGGGYLDQLHHLDMRDLDKRLLESNFTIACDVNNPLLGPTGASRLYGPQKGATPEQVEHLEKALENYAYILMGELGLNLLGVPRAGAAGGCGAGAMAFLKSSLSSGSAEVLKMIDFEHKLEGADLVLTGEGRLDAQTSFDKAPQAVADLAHQKNIPVYIIVGSAVPGVQGFDKIVEMHPGESLAQATRRAVSVL